MSDLYSEVAVSTGVSRPIVKSLAIQILYTKKMDGIQRHSDLVKALTEHVNSMVEAGLVKRTLPTDEAKAERLAEELKRPEVKEIRDPHLPKRSLLSRRT